MNRRLVSLFLVALVSWGGLAVVLITDNPPKLGLDLAGGTAVTLRAESDTDRDVLDQAVVVMRNRIEDVGGVQEPTIQVVGNNSVVVQLPGVTDRERALEAVGTTGQLSFRKVTGVVGVVDADGNPVFFDEAAGLELTVDDDPSASSILVDEDGGIIEVGPAFALGTDLDTAQPLPPAISGSAGWAVSVSFTGEGSRKLETATAELAAFPDVDRRRLAIVLDGEVVSSPPLAASITPANPITDQAVINLGSDGTEGQARDIAVVLRYGALPVEFEVDQATSVSATLGSDSLRAGLIAGIGGLILVGGAMAFYYRALGLIALVGLTVFGSLLVTVYSLLGAAQGLTLTLAGVAGIIVSIGITADSYIVYFERIKELVRAGHPLSDAVTTGFSRAFRTILTADTVSFTGAVLLWFLAVGPVKGFALALGIATVIDVFVAYFYTRNAAALLAGTKLGEGGSFSMLGAAGMALPEAEAAEVPA